MSRVLRDEIINALLDYKYLLNRGYNQKPSLDLVTSHYRLSKWERMVLFRCVHSDRDSSEVCRKKVDPSEICRDRLVIDGFNTLLTIASAIEDDLVYLCDDCFVRDLRSVKFKSFGVDGIKSSALKLMEYVRTLSPLEVTIILDKQVSRSGELRSELSEVMHGAEIVLASKADITVLAQGGIVASSDFVILKRANKVFDMAGYVIMKEFKDKVINISGIFGLKCAET